MNLIRDWRTVYCLMVAIPVFGIIGGGWCLWQGCRTVCGRGTVKFMRCLGMDWVGALPVGIALYLTWILSPSFCMSHSLKPTGFRLLCLALPVAAIVAHVAIVRWFLALPWRSSISACALSSVFWLMVFIASMPVLDSLKFQIKVSEDLCVNSGLFGLGVYIGQYAKGHDGALPTDTDELVRFLSAREGWGNEDFTRICQPLYMRGAWTRRQPRRIIAVEGPHWMPWEGRGVLYSDGTGKWLWLDELREQMSRPENKGWPKDAYQPWPKDRRPKPVGPTEQTNPASGPAVSRLTPWRCIPSAGANTHGIAPGRLRAGSGGLRWG